MSTFDVDEPPQEINQQPSPSSSMFSSLPEDIVLDVLARVPPRNYPILSCVSKTFRDRVRSPEIYKIRSLLGRDSLYICLVDKTKSSWIQDQLQDRCKWFTLRRIENNNKTENRFASVDLQFPYGSSEPRPSVIAVGPEIFFICGTYIPCRSMYIFDSRSGKLRRGPCMQVNRQFRSVGLVGGKIFVIGGSRDDEIEAESFDLKNQIWEKAPISKAGDPIQWFSVNTVSLDRKICPLSFHKHTVTVYDTRDGSSSEGFMMPRDKWWETGVCTIQNVLYVYYVIRGLRWYDSNLKQWRLVNGLPYFYPPTIGTLAMAEYQGKLALLWEEESEDVSIATKIIWCRMIKLSRSEQGIHGSAESIQSLGTVPRSFRFSHCLSVSV